MWASARSTWLAVGPGCDSPLLGPAEQCGGPASNTLPCSAPEVLLLRPHPVPSLSFQSHLTLAGWPGITGMPEHLFGKQGPLSLWTTLPSRNSFILGSFGLWFYMFGLSCWAVDNEQRLSTCRWTRNTFCQLL